MIPAAMKASMLDWPTTFFFLEINVRSTKNMIFHEIWMILLVCLLTNGKSDLIEYHVIA